MIYLVSVRRAQRNTDSPIAEVIIKAGVLPLH